MLASGNRRRPRQNRRLARWPRWAQAWLDDRQRHAAAYAEARAQAPIGPGERLLAVARCAGGDVLAATERALYHQAGQAWARLGWEQVDRVAWDEQRHVLVLTGLTPAVAAGTVLRLARDWDLPAVAAERVGWARMLDQRISLNRAARRSVGAATLPDRARACVAPQQQRRPGARRPPLSLPLNAATFGIWPGARIDPPALLRLRCHRRLHPQLKAGSRWGRPTTPEAAWPALSAARHTVPAGQRPVVQ